MKAIILAAGRGSRMQSLTDDRPKCLIEFKGKPLLLWQIEALRAAGVHEIAIVTGYQRERLSRFGLVEFHNSRWAETQMVSSLACAHAWLQLGPCVVSYSDIFYASSAVTSLLNSTAPMAVTYDTNWRNLWEQRFGDPLLDAETFRLDRGGHLKEIGFKPSTIEEIEGQYMGLLRFTPIGWSELQRIRAQLSQDEADRIQMTRALQRVIEAGRIQIQAIPYSQAWGEFDSAADLTALQNPSS